MNGSTNDPFHQIGGVSVRPDDELVRLRAELSTLQAALEQATKERDEAFGWAQVRDRQVTITNELRHKAIERAEKAEAALAQVQKERDRDRSQLTTFADGLLLAELTATRAALAQVQGERAWQPIETAPKDEYVLLWCAHGQYVACCDERIHGKDIFGWSVDDNKHGPYALRGAAPTHWQPLPPKPTTPEREEP